MRVAIYLLLTLALLPYLLLAAAFLLLGHAISGGTLGSLLTALLTIALWLLSWGLLASATALGAVLALAASDRWRWVGCAALCLAAAGSLATIVVMPDAAPDAGQLLFLAPCLLIAIGSTWLGVAEFRASRPAPSSAPSPVPAMGPEA
jgi:hypothetical protein